MLSEKYLVSVCSEYNHLYVLSSEPCILSRSPLTKVTLSEKYLVSVCSEYNHLYSRTFVYSPGRPWRREAPSDRSITTCTIWPLCTLQVACDEGDSVREVPGIRLLWVPPFVLSDPCVCTLEVASDKGDVVWEVPGIRLLWVQPCVLFDPSVLSRSPVTKVTLSEKYLVSVCSEYNHVYLLTPVYSPGRQWRRWLCPRRIWSSSALSTTTFTLWPVCTL